MTAPDWTTLQLAPGERVLIEASAGTGKTWTISAIYLRLLLECPYSANHIAVTTFTEAASQELRERLRSRLKRAAQLAADAEALPGDAAEHWLIDRWQQQGCREVDRQRLRLALMELDQAPVGTLHALCRKVLSEQPFAASGAFRLGELVPEQAVQDELLCDLKRYLAHADAEGERAEALAALASKSDKVLRQVVRLCCDDAIELQLADPEAESRLLALFNDANAELLEALAARPVWQPRKSKLKNQLLAMAALLWAGYPWADLKDTLRAAPAFADQVRSELLPEVLADPAATLLRDALDLLGQRDHLRLGRALSELAPKLRQWRSDRLLERDQFSFDDLINRVLHALRDDAGWTSGLSQRLHEAWPVVLIDEFQDTDQRQYEIFDRICRDAEGGIRGLLVMIGDPKQAIYAFRGGDIHAYLRAAKGATQRLSLDTNHRSSRALVAALNGFYALAGDGFAAGGIDYRPVLPSARCDATPLSIDGAAVRKPLVLHRVSEAVLPSNKDQREALALSQCVDEIVALLQPGRACLGPVPLLPGDIAVLLPSNRQLLALRQRLQQRGVPCVGSGRSAVFDSPWTEALRLVLHAALDGADAPTLRAALACDLYGLDFNALQSLSDDLPAWTSWVDYFHYLDRCWREQGVLALVNAVLAMAAPRLLARAEGERALTDLRHLGELLQQQSAGHPGREQLLAWLAQQCDDAGDEEATEEQQLRIESDQKRVQLLTLHASKGLEYPVVFLPLMPLHEGRAVEFPLVGSVDGTGRVADLGSARNAEAKRLAAEEDQRERLRVLYVALTRAQYLCHVLVMPVARPESGTKQAPKADPARSALDRLLAQIEQNRDAAPSGSAEAIEWREGWQAQPRRLESPPSPVLVPRAQPLPERRAYVGSYSFSTLIRARRQTLAEDDAAAVDELAMTPGLDGESIMEAGATRTPAAALSALAQVRGAEFGNAVHAIFEHREPALPVIQQNWLVREALRAAGVRIERGRMDALVRALGERIDACLRADLGGGLRLGELTATAQRAEMGFHFALDGIDLQDLRVVCARHGRADLLPASLGQRRLRGFMTGKIDLSLYFDGRCHVLDYKSNDLGDAVEDYQGDALGAAMAGHHYPFQALLYTLALDRYLQQRQPGYAREQHLGDAIYVFIRALGLGAGTGVWRHRFPPALIADLDATFAASALAVTA